MGAQSQNESGAKRFGFGTDELGAEQSSEQRVPSSGGFVRGEKS